jgi:hypothetical protein
MQIPETHTSPQTDSVNLDWCLRLHSPLPIKSSRAKAPLLKPRGRHTGCCLWQRGMEYNARRVTTMMKEYGKMPFLLLSNKNKLNAITIEVFGFYS